MDRDFGYVRALLQRRPSVRVWRRLVGVAHAWGDDPRFAETLSPYICSHLAAWPDALRELPASWLDAALAGRPLPQGDWVRCVHDRDRRLEPREIVALLRHDDLAGVRELDLQYGTHLWELLTGLESCGEGLEVLRIDNWFVSSLEHEVGDPFSRMKGRLRVFESRGAVMGDETLEWLARVGDGFSALEELSLRSSLFGARGARALAGASWLSRLTSLDVSASRMGAEGARVLAESGDLGRIERLCLGYHGSQDDAPDEVAVWFGSGSSLGSLRELDLSGYELDDAGIRVALSHPSTASLESLRVRLASTQAARGFVDAECATTLGSLRVEMAPSSRQPAAGGVLGTLTSALPCLSELELEGVRVGDEDVAALERDARSLASLTISGEPMASAPAVGLVGALAGVRRLSLRTRGGDEVVDALLAGGDLEGLEELRISGDEVSASALARLVGEPRLARLSSLAVFGAGRSGGDVSPRIALERLESLELSGGLLTRGLVSALTSGSGWSELERLVLVGGHAGDDVARGLARGDGLSELFELTLDDVSLSARGARSLGAFVERSRVRVLGLSGNHDMVLVKAQAMRALMDGVVELELERIPKIAPWLIECAREGVFSKVERLRMDRNWLTGSQRRELAALEPTLGGQGLSSLFGRS